MHPVAEAIALALAGTAVENAPLFIDTEVESMGLRIERESPAAVLPALLAACLTVALLVWPGGSRADTGRSRAVGADEAALSDRPFQLNINNADAATLAEWLPGVGPVKAERIVAWREMHGRIERIDDLLAVKGIGAVTLARIREVLAGPRAMPGHASDMPERRNTDHPDTLHPDTQPLSTTEREGRARIAVQALKAMALSDARERGTSAFDQ